MADIFGDNILGDAFNSLKKKFTTNPGNIAEESIKQSMATNTDEKSVNTLNPNRAKNVTQSLMNEYAYISYGGQFVSEGSGGVKNMFTDSNTQPGLLADFDMWKHPTAANIIEWSNSITGSKAFKNGQSNMNSLNPSGSAGSTFATNVGDVIGIKGKQKSAEESMNTQLGNLAPSVGNLKYEWKDFAFVKHFGQIPNNRLITLRRFKLPVLDSGSVLGRFSLVDNMESYGFPKEDYLTSDSARALTYFGEGSGNAINDFLNFSFSLNWNENHEASMDNPKINSTGLVNGIGASNLTGTGFFGAMDMLNTFPGIKDKLDSAGLNKVAGAMGMSTQLGNQSKADSFYDLVVQNKAEFDPYSNGWQYRIYGPVNVISRTSKRARGLAFSNESINLTFSYDVNQVDTLNPKLAMLDVINNILTLTFADGTFYGGDYRFQREPTEFPITLDLENHIKRLMAGEDVSYEELSQSFQGMLAGRDSPLSRVRPDSGDLSMGDYADNIKRVFSGGSSVVNDNSKDLLESLEKFSAVFSSQDSTDDSKKVDIDKASTVKSTSEQLKAFMMTAKDKKDDMASLMSGLGSTFGGILDSIDSLSQGGSMANPLKATINALTGLGPYSIQGISDKIMSVQPLISGEPVGEWHITVGNPMNPFMMIGNLICTNCKLEFGDILGPDDFPTELKATITLKHARDRDMGDIMSMFNMGQGRFYAHVKDKPEPWNTGYSSKTSVNDFGSANNVTTSDGLRNGTTTDATTKAPPIDALSGKFEQTKDDSNVQQDIFGELGSDAFETLAAMDTDPAFNINE